MGLTWRTSPYSVFLFFWWHLRTQRWRPCASAPSSHWKGAEVQVPIDVMLLLFERPSSSSPPSCLSFFFFCVSHVIEWMNVCSRLFFVPWRENWGGEEGRKERTWGKEKRFKWGKGRRNWWSALALSACYSTLAGYLLVSVVAWWLLTLPHLPDDWRALVVTSTLISKPHDWMLCKASDPPRQTLRFRRSWADGTADARDDTQTWKNEGGLVGSQTPKYAEQERNHISLYIISLYLKNLAKIIIGLFQMISISSLPNLI